MVAAAGGPGGRPPAGRFGASLVCDRLWLLLVASWEIKTVVRRHRRASFVFLSSGATIKLVQLPIGLPASLLLLALDVLSMCAPPPQAAVWSGAGGVHSLHSHVKAMVEPCNNRVGAAPSARPVQIGGRLLYLVVKAITAPLTTTCGRALRLNKWSRMRARSVRLVGRGVRASTRCYSLRTTCKRHSLCASAGPAGTPPPIQSAPMCLRSLPE